MKRILLLLLTICSSQLFADKTETVLDIKDTAVAVLNAENLTTTQRYLLPSIIEKNAKIYELEKAVDPKIKQICIDAIKEFNIKEPIALFQYKGSNASIGCEFAYKDLKVTGIICLFIGDIFFMASTYLKSLKLLKYDIYKASIYHELGHYFMGHVFNLKSFNFYKHTVIAGSILGLAITPPIMIGCISNSFLDGIHKKTTLFAVLLLTSACQIGSAFLMHKILKLLFPFYQRKREADADMFAIKNLLTQNYFNAIIGKFLRYRSLHSPHSFKSWENTHPTNLERARVFLQELKKAGINLKHIPFNLKESERAIVQKEVDEQIAKYFPEYIQLSQNNASKNYSHNGNSLGADLINLKLKNSNASMINEYDIDRNIYVMNVLKQDLDNACGRHTIKNLIYFMQAIQQNDLEILINLHDKDVFYSLNKELCEYLRIPNKYQDVTFPHKFFTLFSNFKLFTDKHSSALPRLDNNFKNLIDSICPIPISLDNNNALMIKEFNSKIFSNQCDLFVSSIEKDESKKSSTKNFYKKFLSSNNTQLNYNYWLPISCKKAIDDFKKSKQQLLGLIVLLPSGQVGHWIGVVIRKITNTSFEIFILDSGHNRINDGLKNTLDFLVKEFNQKSNLLARG